MLYTLKRPGSPNYYVEGNFQGKEVKRRSLHTRSAATAEQMRQVLELEVIEQLKHPEDERISSSELSRRFLDHCRHSVKARTQAKYDFVVGRFGQFLNSAGTSQLREITPAVIERYLDNRRQDLHPTRQTHIGKEGLKSDQRVLRRLFNYAIERDYLDRSPMRHFRNLNSRASNAQPFSQDEIKLMLSDRKAGSRPDLFAILLTFLHTGFRISDLTLFKREQVDFVRDQIVLRAEKNGNLVTIAMPPAIRQASSRTLPHIQIPSCSRPTPASKRKPIALTASCANSGSAVKSKADMPTVSAIPLPCKS